MIVPCGCVSSLPSSLLCSNASVEYTRLPTTDPESEGTSDKERRQEEEKGGPESEGTSDKERKQEEEKGGAKGAPQVDEDMLNPLV